MGRWPLPLLDIPLGNQSHGLGYEAFNLLDYYEFTADQYVSLHLEHHFNGRLFSHIPFLKALNLRALVFTRGLWGRLSERNIAINRSNVPYWAPNSPFYYEYGFGVENIGLGNWRLFRVDFSWRGNYNAYRPRVRTFGINSSIRQRF